MEDLIHPVYQFQLIYARQRLVCRAMMLDDRYRVYFNQTPKAELVMNDDMEWMLAGGIILPDEIVDYIGQKIERWYK